MNLELVAQYEQKPRGYSDKTTAWWRGRYFDRLVPQPGFPSHVIVMAEELRGENKKNRFHYGFGKSSLLKS